MRFDILWTLFVVCIGISFLYGGLMPFITGFIVTLILILVRPK